MDVLSLCMSFDLFSLDPYLISKWLFVGPSAVVQTKQSFLKTAE